MTRATAGLPELEEAFTDRVVTTAKLYGWLVAHFRPALTKRGYRTAVQGDAGFMDLVLARGGVVLLRELKRDTTYPDPNQRRWLVEVGEHGGVWRPRDWDAVIIPTLRRQT